MNGFSFFSNRNEFVERKNRMKFSQRENGRNRIRSITERSAICLVQKCEAKRRTIGQESNEQVIPRSVNRKIHAMSFETSQLFSVSLFLGSRLVQAWRNHVFSACSVPETRKSAYKQSDILNSGYTLWALQAPKVSCDRDRIVTIPKLIYMLVTESREIDFTLRCYANEGGEHLTNVSRKPRFLQGSLLRHWDI